VTITANCPAGGAACSETLSLTTTVPVHARTAAAAKKVRTVKLGSARVSVPAGRTAKAKLKLSKPGLALLKKARRHRLKATVALTAGDRTRRLPVRLVLAPARRAG
jgi:hypothetical protein